MLVILFSVTVLNSTRHSTCFFWWWILCDSLIFRLLRAIAKNLRCSRLHSPKNLSRFFGCFDVRSSLQTALSFILLSAKFHLFRCSSSSQHNALRSALCWEPCKAKGPHSTPAHTNKKASLSTCFFWWAGVDSDHRSETQQIYSLPPLATREPAHYGAGDGTRTRNLLITNQLLCQLSYTSNF